MTDAPILIAGGGIGGLAAALALAQAGRRVEVVEQAATATTAGAGIQLGPNAVKVLRQLGVADLVRMHTSAPSALAVYSGGSGACLTRMPLGATIEVRCGAPYWTIHRADLHAALLEVVNRTPRITLSHDREVRDVRLSQAAGIEVSFADGSTREAAALIGADGVWSRVRSAVAPDFAPVASGYCAYRTIIPIAQVGDLDTDVVGAWLSPHAHVVHYPIVGGRALNIVVIARNVWTGMEWTAPADRAEVAAALAGLPPRLTTALAAAPEWHKWSLPQPVILPAWHRGRVALLGDAAHAMLPFFAQGGAMALEDAVVLASCVERELDLSAAFAAYASRRRERVARVQSASMQNGRIFHLSGPLAVARGAAMRITPPAIMMRRFDWLYGFDATTG